jgi:hypothetical protein
MSDLAAYLAATVLLGFGLYRLLTDRGGASPIQRHGIGFLTCQALTMALLGPSSPRMAASLGVGGTALLLLAGAARIAAISFLMFLARATERRPARGWPVTAAVLAQAATVLLFLGARPVFASDGSVLVAGAGRWLLAAHDLLFAGYAEWAIGLMIGALAREARRLAPGPVRSGTRLMLAACWAGVGWTAWSVDDVVGVLRTGVQNGSEDLVSNIFGVACAVLVVAACLLARWREILAAPHRWTRWYLTYRRLAPLWEALTAEMPQLALGARRVPGGLEFALYRRVIEIHDGRLALRPYMPGRMQRPPDGDASGRDQALAALNEAACIAAALNNLRLGHRPGTAPADQNSYQFGEGLGSVHAEAAWLAQVSTAFARLPATASEHRG